MSSLEVVPQFSSDIPGDKDDGNGKNGSASPKQMHQTKFTNDSGQNYVRLIFVLF